MDLNMLEEVSAAVHQAWMDGKTAKGIHTRMSETGEELMVPYGELSEAAKEQDRASVRATLGALEKLGYKVQR